MKILVTGGTGFIGSHTVVELQQNNYEAVIADNLSNSYENVVDAIQQISGVKPAFENTDLTCIDQTRSLFKKYPDITGVIHFAAFKAVGESSLFPLKYYHNNLFSLINLLTVMQEYKVNHLVFSSSCTVYGQPEDLPVDEFSPVKKALSPYGNTKQISEEIIWDSIKSSDLSTILLRYFNPIGAHESALIGELPLGVPSNLVPYITQTAIGKHPTLYVYGNDYDTADGTCIRDYIHVDDIAKAHVAALNRMLKKQNLDNVEIFNLGTGKGYSVLEVIRTFEKISNRKLPYKIVQRRPGDVDKIWADTRLANEILGWKAEKDLDEMILSAWKWEQRYSEKTKTNECNK
jgi:UDP-glucose 4-epimerase